MQCSEVPEVDSQGGLRGNVVVMVPWICLVLEQPELSRLVAAFEVRNDLRNQMVETALASCVIGDERIRVARFPALINE